MTAEFNIRHPLTAAADRHLSIDEQRLLHGALRDSVTVVAQGHREPVDISDITEEWHRNPVAALLRADANLAANDTAPVVRCAVCQRFLPCPVHPPEKTNG